MEVRVSEIKDTCIKAQAPWLSTLVLLESSGVLNQISNKQNEQSSDCKPNYSGTLPEEVNEKRVSVALKKTSEIIQDIDCLLSNSKSWKMKLLHVIKS